MSPNIGHKLYGIWIPILAVVDSISFMTQPQNLLPIVYSLIRVVT